MHPGKQTWKHLVKSSTDIEHCIRSCFSISIRYCRTHSTILIGSVVHVAFSTSGTLESRREENGN
ncbi:hypothetical protein DPEC_G00210320 [Dallia pectoralis]|uniref:Uncharacterized protein n=1 Tax=Dallia pectoralis TaxID=75939 RepID=A0ACC2G5T7_DALPE|nr:hypothetical protein DPEC_G00210320 [Dallia pectoralis]